MNDDNNLILMLVRKGALKQYRPPIMKNGTLITAEQCGVTSLQKRALESLEPKENIFKNLPTQLQYYLEYCAEIGENVHIHKSRYYMPGDMKKEDFLVQLIDMLRIHHEQLLHHVNEEGGKLDVTEHDWYYWIEKERLRRGLEESERTILRDLPEG